ncbi:PspC domain-containing protein [Jiangella ureilytica]|nr:PspC domain-containing protein [Jiangella ureilytica]
MSDLPPASPAAAATPRVTDEFRSLRRSRSDRVVAGVLGGLGRRLGIDPVVLRVTTVVLAIFGGVGVLLYAIAWLMVPAEDEERSILDQALGRGENRRSGTVPLALLLATVGLVSGIGIIAGTWDGGVLLLLAIMGVYLLLRRRDDEDERARAEGPQEAWFDSPYVYDPTVAPTAPGATAAGTASAATGTAGAATGTAGATAGAATTPGPAGPTSGWPEGPDWGPPPAPPTPAPPLPPEKPAKQRSHLGLITFCLALVSVGVLAVNEAAWANYPPALFVAVPLGIVAIGLLVGAWYGRSRGLIFLGILLSLALIPATWLSQWDFSDVGDATYRYTTASQVPVDKQEHGAGSILYDLSAVTLTDGQTTHLDVSQGVGELTIILPPDADVTVERASIGAGDITVFDESRDGAGVEYIGVVNNGSDGPGGGRIVIHAEIGAGELVVTR